ncbi:hypothetical protein OC835_002554 [Tilletia horrida]|nr:hypothetical protein OC835_002554 [Tilletia horrida]
MNSTRRRHAPTVDAYHPHGGGHSTAIDEDDDDAHETTAFLRPHSHSHSHSPSHPRPEEEEDEARPQPPRQHNADLAARYQRTMAEAQQYRNPPLARRLLLLVFVLVLLWTASRLQFRARTEVRKWRYQRAVASGEIDPDMFDDEEGVDPWDAYEAGMPSIWESFGFVDGGAFR